ncbi:MAG: ribulose-phosphate 3-epimerase [Acidimicrobiia bacterium]
MNPVRIAPSLLAADFAHLADEVSRVEPYVDLLHVDVMDGHFVHNLSFGLPVIASLRKTTKLYFDCHLMMTNPDSYFGEFAEAGADLVSVHLETFPDPTDAAKQAREAGLDFGLVLSPHVPFEAAQPHLELCDLLLVMSVNPGFGGQAFKPEVLPKVRQARETVERQGLAVDIQVDGGVTAETAPLAREAGADILVAGTAIFRDPDPVEAVRRIREAVDQGWQSGS